MGTKFYIMNMESKTSTICIFSLFLMHHFLSPSRASFFTTTPSSKERICNSTSFPLFCNSLLPHNQTATIHDYAKISIQDSLATTKNFISLLNGYLNSQHGLAKATIQALEDCLFLFDLSMDFLSTMVENIDSKNTLDSFRPEDSQTLLSAVLTNHETCLDGIKETNSASNVKNSHLNSLYSGSMLYSVSLHLFSHGWVRDAPKKWYPSEKKHVFSNIDFGSNAELPLKMSSKDQKTYESLTGKKLVQTSATNNVSVMQVVFVDQNGSGNFSTINDAVAAAPEKIDPGDGYFLIYVFAGVYEEYVIVPKKKHYLMMIGAGINQTIITGNHSVGVEKRYSTFNSSTFAVVGQGFVAVNITFRNTAGPENHQAVALRNGANMSTFYRCSFEGYQDTLYTHSFHQFYRDCDVYGTVDFIFGHAEAVFQNCNIFARLPLPGQFNAITAQGRNHSCHTSGISIQNCSILAASDLALSKGTVRTFLGRPWRKYSRTVYMRCFIDSLIDPSGWKEWSVDFAGYYGEFENHGPGSGTDSRVEWPDFHVMNETDATNFTVSNFILGDYWLPATGVPYNGGL